MWGSRRKGSEEPAGPDPDHVRVTVFVRGYVQGVGFRWWTTYQARTMNLCGYARNLDDGRVEVLAQGAKGDVERLLALLQEQPSTARRPGRVTGVSYHWLDPVSTDGEFLDY